MEVGVFEKKSSQDLSWADLGPIWVAKRGPRRGLLETKLGSKRGRKSEAKKGLVLGGLGGGWLRWALGHFEPGVIKGETGWHLPPRL